LAKDSILKRVYANRQVTTSRQETDSINVLQQYQAARCKVCLVRENNEAPSLKLDHVGKVYALVKEELASSDREIMLSIMLDSGLNLIGIETVAVGSINVCGSTIAEVFKSAILSNASCIVLCHNHPSGSLEPSTEDIAFTKKVVSCGMMLNVRLHDHLILSHRGFWSMNESGLIRP